LSASVPSEKITHDKRPLRTRTGHEKRRKKREENHPRNLIRLVELWLSRWKTVYVILADWETRNAKRRDRCSKALMKVARGGTLSFFLSFERRCLLAVELEALEFR